MYKVFLAFPLAVVLSLLPYQVNSRPSLTEEQITQLIIQQSIASYPGNCPCPYNQASNGSRCGKRSAYSKPGGASPICYPEDVTPEMIKRFRRWFKLMTSEKLPIYLALSGGGTRAMAFHLGVLKCLAAENVLDRVKKISTVSGGSLLIGLLLKKSTNTQ